MPAPKGKAAAAPRPPIIEEGPGGPKACNCPEKECRVKALDHDAFFCRKGNEPEDERPVEADLSTLTIAITEMICQERGLDPDQFYMGVKWRERVAPEAIIMIRAIHIIIGHGGEDA